MKRRHRGRGGYCLYDIQGGAMRLGSCNGPKCNGPIFPTGHAQCAASYVAGSSEGFPLGFSLGPTALVQFIPHNTRGSTHPGFLPGTTKFGADCTNYFRSDLAFLSSFRWSPILTARNPRQCHVHRAGVSILAVREAEWRPAITLLRALRHLSYDQRRPLSAER